MKQFLKMKRLFLLTSVFIVISMADVFAEQVDNETGISCSEFKISVQTTPEGFFSI